MGKAVWTSGISCPRLQYLHSNWPPNLGFGKRAKAKICISMYFRLILWYAIKAVPVRMLLRVCYTLTPHAKVMSQCCSFGCQDKDWRGSHTQNTREQKTSSSNQSRSWKRREGLNQKRHCSMPIWVCTLLSSIDDAYSIQFRALSIKNLRIKTPLESPTKIQFHRRTVEKRSIAKY